MSRALAWILAALSILISCALAYQEASLLASGPKPEYATDIPAVVLSELDEVDLIDENENSTQVDKSRRYLVEHLAKKLDLPMTSISMGTAVGESAARVLITCSADKKPKIDRVLDDLQFPLKLLDVVSVAITDESGKPVETNAAGAETLGYPLGRDLVISETIKTLCKPVADAVLESGIEHNKRCMQADPNDPALVANEYVLKRRLMSQPASADPAECSTLAEIEKKTAKKFPDRANRASHLIGILGCTTSDASAIAASKLGVDEQAQYIRDQIHPDIIRSYLISDVYDRNNQPLKAKAALRELPEINHDVEQSLLVDGIGFLLTGIGLLAYFVMQKPKMFQLPDAPDSVACPYPYGWFKPYLIVFIAFIFAIGGFIVEATVLGGQAEETTALLVTYFDPIRRAWLDNLDELMLLLPVILAATWLVNKGKFKDFVRLHVKTDKYSTKQLVKIGLECFILSWSLAMVATVISYWYHFPWQKPSTVSTELLIASGSIPALAVLFVGYAVLAPVLEEIAFRGILHPALRRHFSMWPSLIIGSSLFACVHFEFTPWWLLDKFLFAAVNVYAFEKTGSIVPGIVSHTITNTLVMVFMLAALS